MDAQPRSDQPYLCRVGFINQVDAMIPDHLDPNAGLALIDSAQAVIESLGG